MTLRLGFSGTRHGMIAPQRFAFEAHMRSIKVAIGEWHHGDCVGSDAEGHRYIRKHHIMCLIHIHPPTDLKNRAHMDPDVYYLPKHFHERNEDIVDAVDEMIFTPGSMTEKENGGTWYTYRYAVKVGKPLTIISPLGKIQRLLP